MAENNDPFGVLMTIAQDQQGYFTTKQALWASPDLAVTPRGWV